MHVCMCMILSNLFFLCSWVESEADTMGGVGHERELVRDDGAGLLIVGGSCQRNKP